MTEQVIGKITRIICYTQKGDAGASLQSAMLRQGFGMDGDFYANGGERQLSLLTSKARQQIDAQAETGLCFARFRENLRIDGITPELFYKGARLQIGEAVIEISADKKRCHQECPLFSAGRECLIPKQSAFAKVITSGIVRMGDAVSINK